MSGMEHSPTSAAGAAADAVAGGAGSGVGGAQAHGDQPMIPHERPGMTLLVTAVAGDGIVLGTDSALTTNELGEQAALTGFSKIVPIPHLNTAISISGSARIGPVGRSTWITTWLREFCLNV